jgi:hypothetical protein
MLKKLFFAKNTQAGARRGLSAIPENKFDVENYISVLGAPQIDSPFSWKSNKNLFLVIFQFFLFRRVFVFRVPDVCGFRFLLQKSHQKVSANGHDCRNGSKLEAPMAEWLANVSFKISQLRVFQMQVAASMTGCHVNKEHQHSNEQKELLPGFPQVPTPVLE